MCKAIPSGFSTRSISSSSSSSSQPIAWRVRSTSADGWGKRDRVQESIQDEQVVDLEQLDFVSYVLTGVNNSSSNTRSW